jgi:hypothetical protein
MKVELELHNGKSSVVIGSIYWCPLMKAVMCTILLPFKPFRHGRQRLTHVVYWMRTGKMVPKGKLLHHIDHNPLNNRFNNLMLCSRAEHAALHHTGVKRSLSTRRKIQMAAKRWSSTPEFKRTVSSRAKQQHAEKNFGACTWKERTT